MKLVAIIFLCVASVWALPKAGGPVPISKPIGGRIVGGQIAYSGEFPYSAAIYASNSDGTFFCGGIIIDPSWILTAGQCIDGYDSWRIILGSTSLLATDSLSLTLTTNTSVLHPDFDASTLTNDIGLIQLSWPLNYSTNVQAAHLPTDDIADGSSGIGFGWGQPSDEDEGLVNDLNWVGLTTVSNDECRIVFGDQIVDTMVCAQGATNEGICFGDSGSPLIYHDSKTATTIVLAVATFISGNGCDAGDPSGYTRVSIFIDWIWDTIGTTTTEGSTTPTTTESSTTITTTPTTTTTDDSLALI